MSSARCNVQHLRDLVKGITEQGERLGGWQEHAAELEQAMSILQKVADEQEADLDHF